MRIALVLTFLLLTACTTAQPVNEAPKARIDPRVAETVCRKKGYERGSFEYAQCYDNHPAVQAWGRDNRISNLAIITQNRSERVTSGRSYPVE